MEHWKKFLLNEKGMALTELALAIVVSAALIAAGYALVSRIFATDSVTSTKNGVIAGLAEMRVAHKSDPNFAGVDTATAATNRWFASFVNTTTTITSPIGPMTVAPAAGNAEVELTFTGLTSENCLLFVNGLPTDFTNITVGTTVVKATKAAQVNKGAVGTACAAAPVDVALRFDRG